MGEPSSQDAAPPLQDAAPPTLFQEIMAQWEWLQQAHDYVVAMPALRERVSSFRKSAWEFTSTAKAAAPARRSLGRTLCSGPAPYRGSNPPGVDRDSRAAGDGDAAAVRCEQGCAVTRRAPAKPIAPVPPLTPHPPGDLSRSHPPLIPAASRSRAASLTPTNQPTHRTTTHSTPLRATRAEHWAALLAFRRQYPAVIVAAATGVSVLPALAHLRTSKLTAVRTPRHHPRAARRHARAHRTSARARKTATRAGRRLLQTRTATHHARRHIAPHTSRPPSCAASARCAQLPPRRRRRGGTALPRDRLPRGAVRQPRRDQGGGHDRVGARKLRDARIVCRAVCGPRTAGAPCELCACGGCVRELWPELARGGSMTMSSLGKARRDKLAVFTDSKARSSGIPCAFRPCIALQLEKRRNFAEEC